MIKNKLFYNTFMLYLLTFSNYIFGFITIPYQTRILGPEIYGKIGFAVAFTTYFQMILDFGFILSATEDVAKNKDNKSEISKIFTSVLVCKFLLIITNAVILIIICLSIPLLREDIVLFILYYIYIAVNSLLPDYIYRGLEKMQMITYRTILIKLFFTIMIFLFLKNASQYYCIPLLNIIGSTIAVVSIYTHMAIKLKIKIKKVSRLEIWNVFKKSSYYFYSRIATTVYTATNTFLLGLIYPSGIEVGYFTSAEKLVSTARSGFSPIADSLYPYMIKNKDYKLLKKIFKIIMPIVILGCMIMYFFAEEICIIVFGIEFKGVGSILRLLIPLIAMALPNYLLGFPILSPLGLSKYANISTIVGAVIHMVGLLLLSMSGVLNLYTVCILTCITEASVLIIRVGVVFRSKKANKSL